jgi:uncharacterized damage-inducible protein DinB
MLLKAVRAHGGAAEDEEIRKLLHHVVAVQRFFLSCFLERAFDENDMKAPESFNALEAMFHATHDEERAFVAVVEEAALARVLELPRLKEIRPTVGETMVQVVMHSQGHRAQCAARLRMLGGSPPTIDYILWLKDRPGVA